MTKRISHLKVALLPLSNGVQTLLLHLVHPDDVVDAGVENDDANLPSEVGLELPEESDAVEAVQGGFMAPFRLILPGMPQLYFYPYRHFCPSSRSSQTSLARLLSTPRING